MGKVSIRGHEPVLVAPKDWRCKCGLELGIRRIDARPAFKHHLAELNSRTLSELLDEAWQVKILPRVTVTESSCWEYEGPKWGAGRYGCVWVDKPRQTHRVAATLFLGLDLEDSSTYVCHRCDNPPCCNPAHLFLGAAIDNAHDAQSKGRLRSGSAPHDVCRNGHDMTLTRKTKRNGATYCGECHKEYMRAYKNRVREAS